MSKFISKINTYHNHRGIEIQEEELVSGKFPSSFCQYTALVTIMVNTPDGQIPQQISTKYHAISIEEAFKKAEPEIEKEIENFKKKIEKDFEELKKEAVAPQIITP
jgi:molecular chaperone GrpE (heat shock protein)